jgi:hypothetical protein
VHVAVDEGLVVLRAAELRRLLLLGAFMTRLALREPSAPRMDLPVRVSMVQIRIVGSTLVEVPA